MRRVHNKANAKNGQTPTVLLNVTGKHINFNPALTIKLARITLKKYFLFFEC